MAEKDTNLKNLKVLLIEDDPGECADISRYIEKTDGIQLIGATNSVEKAYADVCDCLPDAIILDIELHKGEGDGIKFLEKLYTSGVFRPFILVTTDNTSKIIYDRIRELGTDFIISKNQDKYNAAYVVDFLLSMKSTIMLRKANRDVPKELLTLEDRADTVKRIIKRIDAELDLIGISPRVLGRKYLVDAIQMMMVKPVPNYCNVIASKYGKSSQSIDHAMSNAIKRTWAAASVDTLSKIYTAKLSSKKGYPTYSEFVHFYARKIKNDL